MQYVRCDACGAKALFAASRCPKCAHAFFLRNYKGGMVPLAHCSKCDTYYPRSAGGCKWCGTKLPAAGFSGRSVAAVGLSALAIGAVIYFQAFSRREAAGSPPDSLLGGQPAEVYIPPPTPAVVTPADSSPVDTGSAEDSLLVAPPAAALPATTVPITSAIPRPVAPPPAPARWGRARALTYINVRSDADRTAPIVGVINPQVQVEVGARFRGWRQVRAPGIAGWVDPRNLAIDSSARP